MKIDYNDGKWHDWKGGKCPVHPDTKVEAQTRDLAIFQELADYLFWDHEGDGADIIGFRVIDQYKAHRQPRTFWVDPKAMFAYSDDHGAGHIRVVEVIDND